LSLHATEIGDKHRLDGSLPSRGEEEAAAAHRLRLYADFISLPNGMD